MDSRGKEDDESTVASSRSKRGKVCLNGVAQRRAKGVKLQVEFNKHGQPVGKVSTKMQSYIGLLAREHVKVHIKTWKGVAKDVKNLIWETVHLSYVVPPTWRKGCLESASVKWRNWKHALHKQYILPNEGNPTKLYEPPADSGISEREWSQFVIYCISADFKKLSAKQKERREKNIYNHRLSRKGYAGMAEEMKDELVGDQNIDIVIMWKKARLNKKGSVENEDLKKVVDKIEECIRDKEQATLSSDNDHDDLLTSILEKSEHSGRVRAVGAYVKPTAFFDLPKEKRPKVDEKVDKYELQVAKQKIEECNSQMHEWRGLMGEMLNRIGNLESVLNTRDKFSMEKGSCSVTMRCPNNPIEDEDDEDVIYVDSIERLQGKQVALKIKATKMIVAYGTIAITGPMLHGAPMPNDAVLVSVDEVVDDNENTLLPIRVSDEISTVGSALGTHVAWPKELVAVKDETPVQRKNEKKEKERMVTCYSSLPITMKALCCILEPRFKVDQGLRVELDVEVFGYELHIWIMREDFIPFCELEPITGNCIVAYVWHLYKHMKEHEMSDKFLFVNPFGISHAPKVSRDDRARKLADRLLEATSNQLILVPVNVGEHWILTIIEPYKERVYLMDPLTHRNRDGTWKSVVETAMTIFNATKEKKKFKKAPNWEVVKGPMQPDSKQCGFYVLRYMKEILKAFENGDFISMTSLFQNREYSLCEINEVREDWATCMINGIDM